MVLVSKNADVNRRVASKKRFLSTALLAVGLLSVPIIFEYVTNPIVKFSQYSVRLENGSLLHKILLRRLDGPKIIIYLFNVTNANDFLSGRDPKVKLEEIGPFVYQEYRTQEDLEINQEPGIMRYTPKHELVFVPEESVGCPKDYHLVVPNLAMLVATALMSKYPYFVRQIFNVVAANSHAKAFIKITAYQQLWGYPNPLIDLANTVVPGLIYFKSVGLLERLYDLDVDFRLDIGTKGKEKFVVKKATKFRSKKQNNSDILAESVVTYKDTYEGAAFPPDMTPDLPINIYWHGSCRTLQLQHFGSKRMHYGGDAFVYHIHNTTFMDHQQCDTKGWCPSGLKNFAPCYFGFPLVVSKGHFLDADPRLLDLVEGLKPDRKLHDTEILIDPKIGAAVAGSMCLQLNLFLADVGYNPETSKLKDTVLPISNLVVKAPQMLPEVRDCLQLLYSQGPYILLGIEVACVLLAFGLLTYTVKLIHCNWVIRKRKTKKSSTKSFKIQQPLLLVNTF